MIIALRCFFASPISASHCSEGFSPPIRHFLFNTDRVVHTSHWMPHPVKCSPPVTYIYGFFLVVCPSGRLISILFIAWMDRALNCALRYNVSTSLCTQRMDTRCLLSGHREDCGNYFGPLVKRIMDHDHTARRMKIRREEEDIVWESLGWFIYNLRERDGFSDNEIILFVFVKFSGGISFNILL